eukprot:IDg21793t1
MISSNAKIGLSVFTDTGSICITVQSEETKIRLYYTSRAHEKCSLLEGQELSAKKVGRAIQDMQRKIRTLLFTDLMRSATLPDLFHELCDALADNDSNETE